MMILLGICFLAGGFTSKLNVSHSKLNDDLQELIGPKGLMSSNFLNRESSVRTFATLMSVNPNSTFEEFKKVGYFDVCQCHLIEEKFQFCFVLHCL